MGSLNSSDSESRSSKRVKITFGQTQTGQCKHDLNRWKEIGRFRQPANVIQRTNVGHVIITSN